MVLKETRSRFELLEQEKDWALSTFKSSSSLAFLKMTSAPVISLILVFGEILAQAVCTRYGLTVGAAMVPLVRVLLLLFFPISYPVSKLRQIPDSEYTIRTSFLASELYSVQVDLATDNLAWI
ncbi:hypothetical protein Peur_049101 [Populus x canadensis]